MVLFPLLFHISRSICGIFFTPWPLGKEPFTIKIDEIYSISGPDLDFLAEFDTSKTKKYLSFINQFASYPLILSLPYQQAFSMLYYTFSVIVPYSLPIRVPLSFELLLLRLHLYVHALQKT